MVRNIDTEILEITSNWTTTYKIAIKLKIAWTTVNSHCLKLQVKNLMRCRIEEDIKPKTFWKRVEKQDGN